MALKKCKECGKDVSTKALACPNCGNPIKNKTYAISCSFAVIIFLVVLWVAKEVLFAFSEVRIFGRKINLK